MAYADFLLGVEDEIGRVHVGNVVCMDLHVDMGECFCRSACVGVNDRITPGRHDIDRMRRDEVLGLW